MKISIIGLGWYGLPLAAKLAANHEVVGTKTSAASASEVKISGVKALPFLLNPAIESANCDAIFDASCVVINIPPSRKSEEVTTFYQAQMDALFKEISEREVDHIIFISSTGVFGDQQMQVDEDTIPQPSTEAGKALNAAELFFKTHFTRRVSIIRPGGLVGGERHPAKYLAGRSGLSGKDHPVNLVHRNDLIALTEFLIHNKTDRMVYHAVAEHHPKKAEYYTATAEKMNLPKPQFDPEDHSLGKEISSAKTKASTGISFKYDDPYDMF